ncbi:L-ribulose-5-phosphate 3-epimerase [Muricomes intestini]|uniref:L-ribulose-5-phosphate 3-epimerase n=1 Tax=Muricomes intestini TaxID=1796634 RepID=A0A4R3KF89_9FIRM|nr:L-ribulose-5-phosphate 3-epimerase [Muricomes intestini]TCS81649.1 L-ribulose-5-phosphate 3-epimerase [Muricomes intestini]HAX53642.1 L-ribulose-5-phosphate 4-epimerase [Lachnospiraceae bacterium]HCR82693.1 L-ribulose-5-phosphate 4-epimerase [Lachnospiraceae bacterium]
MKRYTIGLYEKAMPSSLTWKEKMEAAKKAGYDFIEISIDETDEKLARLDWSKEERLELIKMMYETGIPIRTMCLSGHRKYPLGSNDEQKIGRGMEIMEKALQFADDLGIRIIQLAGYDVYYEKGSKETRERFRRNLNRAVHMASSLGIVMGFETMETKFMNTVEKAMTYVKENESPYLNVYPDCGNITNAAVESGKDVLDDIEIGRGHMVAMHLKETNPGIFRNMMYGQGHVQFDTIINKAWKMGIRKYVTEFWYLGDENWENDLMESNSKMRSILDKQ